MTIRIVIAAATILFATALQVSADQIFNDDLIIEGKLCSGFDCINGQIFDTETIRLKENNTRLTFIDLSADPAAQSWRLVANSATSGATDHFQLHVQPNLSAADNGVPIAHFGVLDDGSVALGRESEIISGAVSIGQDTLKRRVINVANALADTDLVTVADIGTQSAALHARFDAIDAQLDEIERAVQAAEDSKLVKSGGGGSVNLLFLLCLLGGFTLLRFLNRRPEARI